MKSTILFLILFFANFVFGQKPKYIQKPDNSTFHFYNENMDLKFEAKADYAEALQNGNFYLFESYNDTVGSKFIYDIKFYNQREQEISDSYKIFTNEAKLESHKYFIIKDNNNKICIINYIGILIADLRNVRVFWKHNGSDKFKNVNLKKLDKRLSELRFVTYQTNNYKIAKDTFFVKSNKYLRKVSELSELGDPKNHNKIAKVKQIQLQLAKNYNHQAFNEINILNKRNITSWKNSFQKDSIGRRNLVNYTKEYIKLYDNLYVKNDNYEFSICDSNKVELSKLKFSRVGFANYYINKSRINFIKAADLYSNRYFYFDKCGNSLFEEYDNVSPLKNDLLFSFKYNIESKFEYLPPNNLKTNTKVGIIDTSGNEILPCIYDKISLFNDEMKFFIVAKNGKFGLVDSLNQVIIKPIFDSEAELMRLSDITNEKLLKKNSKKRLKIYKRNKKNVENFSIDSLDINKYEEWYINEKPYVKVTFVHKENFTTYQALLNAKGKIIIPPIYEYLTIRNSKYVQCAIQSKFRYKNYLNDNYFNLEADQFLFPIAIAKSYTNYHILENNDFYYFDYKIDSIYHFKEFDLTQPFKVCKKIENINWLNIDGKIYDYYGKLMKDVKFKYNDHSFVNGYYKLTKQSNISWNVIKNEQANIKVKYFYALNDTLIVVVNNEGKKGVLNNDLDTIVPIKFDDITLWRNNFFIDNIFYDYNLNKISEINLPYKAYFRDKLFYVDVPRNTMVKKYIDDSFVTDNELNFYNRITNEKVNIVTKYQSMEFENCFFKHDFIKIDSFESSFLLKPLNNPNRAKYFISDKNGKILSEFIAFGRKIKFNKDGNIVILHDRNTHFTHWKNLKIVNYKGILVFKSDSIKGASPYFINDFLTVEKINNEMFVIDKNGKIDSTKQGIKIYNIKPLSRNAGDLVSPVKEGFFLSWKDKNGINNDFRLNGILTNLKPLNKLYQHKNYKFENYYYLNEREEKKEIKTSRTMRLFRPKLETYFRRIN